MRRIIWCSRPLAKVGASATVFVSLIMTLGCAASDSQSRASGSQDPLHRPLEIPRLASGEPCPRSPGGRPNPDIAIALGSGPAYPVMGLEAEPPAPDGVVPLRKEDRRGAIYWRKTLWAVDPQYDGPVLIRARRMDEPQQIFFAIDEQKRPELEFPREDTDSWRYGPSLTLLPEPGCYGFQVDGTTFSKVIVFEAAQR
ncbi:MAG: hypothetical protein MSC30_11090 [Gaiellaceae bacterium MAG52_C11]|nr:hypothetical protein [Candidatus Gaiellasilicea maunaloa]